MYSNEITHNLLRSKKYILTEYVMYLYILTMHKGLKHWCLCTCFFSQNPECRQTSLFFIWVYNLVKA